MFLAKRLLGGIISVVSNINPCDFFPSDPPPPRKPLNFQETHETEEEKQFREIFRTLAGDDMEICPAELKKVLEDVFRKQGRVKMSKGISIETCRSMVAVLDSDSTGRLGFHEFKYLWKNIVKWQKIFCQSDRDRSGCISSRELPTVLKEAGFPVGKDTDLYKVIERRYMDQNEKMDIDNFLALMVRLDSMCRTFKTMDKNNCDSVDFNIEEWLQLTMYS